MEFKEFLTEQSFLVTGGAGFIGSNLVEYLLAHDAGKVRVLDNFSTGFRKNIHSFNEHPAFELIEGDIRDMEACRKACDGIQFVSHQAALVSVPRSFNDPVQTHAVNSSGFLNILVAARDAGVIRLVYASSSSVYGDDPDLPKQEDKVGKPLSPYAVSKSNNEQYARVFGEQFGLPTIGLRYFNVFGPNQDPESPYAAVIPKFIRAIKANTQPAIDGDGNQSRDFTYVENVIEANLCAFFADQREAINEVYNIALGESNSVNRLFELLCQIEGKEFRPIYRESRKGDIRDSLADIRKAVKLLGYVPKVKFEEGIKRTLELWDRHGA